MADDFIPVNPDLGSLEQKYNLPQGMLTGVHMTESSGNYDAVNPTSKARGGFQFLPETAKQYGVDLTNPQSQAEGAAKYLSDLLKKNGGDYKKALSNYGGFVTKDPSDYISKVEKYMKKPDADFIPVASDDFIPVQKQNEGFRAFNNMVDTAKQIGADAEANPPKDWEDRLAGASGVAAGIPLGAVEFFGGLAQQMARLGKQAVTHPTEWSAETYNKLLSEPTIAQAFAKWREEQFPMFSQGMNQINAPFSIGMAGIGGGVSQLAGKLGAGQQGQELSEKLAELAVGLLGAKHMLKGKGKGEDLPSSELKDLVKEQPPEDVSVSNPTNVPDMYEWDKGAAREDQPLGDIVKTEANPNPIPEGLPRAMDEEGNLKPTNYDKVKDTEISRDPIQDEIDAYKAAQEDKAWEARDEQQKAETKQVQDLYDKYNDQWNPEQGSRTVEKIQRPISNRSPMARQRGALDISDLAALVDRLRGKSKEATDKGPLTTTPEDRGIYAGSPRYDGRPEDMQEAARATENHPLIEGENLLRQRGYTFEQTDKGWQTKVNGKELGFEPSREAAITSALQDATKPKPLGGVGKKGFKQGGALNLFSDALNKTPKEAEDFRRSKAIVGRMDMPVEDFMQKFEKPKPSKDMAVRYGAGSGTFRYMRELANNIKDPEHAIHTAKYLYDTMHVLKEKMERLIVEQVHPAKIALMRTYGSANLGTFMPFWRTLQKDMRIALSLEKDTSWFDGKNYVPTKEQLMKAGMSERSAKAWDMYYQATDKVLWPAIVDFAKLKGIPVPERVPGYLPHFTQGLWRVQMRRVGKNADGTPKLDRLATVGVNSRAAALQMKRHLEDYGKGSNVEVEILQPNMGHDIASIIDGFFEMKDSMNLNKGLSSLIERVYEQASIGQLKNALERKANPQILHQLDRIKNADDFQLTPNQARLALNRMTDIMEYIPTMNMRAHFLTEHFFPLQMAGYFEEMPGLRGAVTEDIRQFLRIPDTAGAFLDNWVNNLLVKAGFDYRIAQKMVGKMNGMASVWYLFYKPSFYAVQLAQKVATQGILWTKASEQSLAGDRVGSPVKAIAQSLMPSRFDKLSSGESIKDFAEKTGNATPVYVENLRGGFIKDFIGQRIERQTRTSATQTAYHFLRDSGYSEEEALRSAGQLNKEMNVDYSQDLGKPTAFSKEGNWMKPLFLFMQYPLHQLQMLNYQASAVRRSISARNMEAFRLSATGLAYNLAFMYALGGLLGMPFAPMYDEIAQYVNQNLGWNWMTPTKLAREFGQVLREHDFGDDYANALAGSAEFGLYSQQLGYDVSGSARGPQFNEPSAFPHMLHMLVNLGMLAGQHMQDYGQSEKADYAAVKEAPTAVRGALTEWLQQHYDTDKTTQRVIDKLAGKVSGEQAPIPYDPNLPGDYTRSAQDERMNILGLKSVGESQFNHTMAIDSQTKKQMDAVSDRIMQQFKERPNMLSQPENVQKLVALAQVQGGGIDNQGRDIGGLLDEIINYQMMRQLTETQRRELGLSGLKSLADWQRWKQEILQQTVK